MSDFWNVLDADQLFRPPYVFPPTSYDSPLEHRFAHEAAKYFRLGLDLVRQVEVATTERRFRLDFYVTAESGRYAFECDGFAFHSGQIAEAHDAHRDALILATDVVDVLYRLPGHAVWVLPEACFYAISRHDPLLFSERGLINLANLARRFRNEPDLQRLRMDRRTRA